MNKKIVVRLFYAPACSGGKCACGPSEEMKNFETLTNKLVEKFGEDSFEFEAHTSIDTNKFSFLKRPADSKESFTLPLVTANDKVFEAGKVPTFPEVEKVVNEQLKVK